MAHMCMTHCKNVSPWNFKLWTVSRSSTIGLRKPIQIRAEVEADPMNIILDPSHDGSPWDGTNLLYIYIYTLRSQILKKCRVHCETSGLEPNPTFFSGSVSFIFIYIEKVQTAKLCPLVGSGILHMDHPKDNFLCGFRLPGYTWMVDMFLVAII